MKESINQLINDEAVRRTAPATPGLSNISIVLHFNELHCLGNFETI